MHPTHLVKIRRFSQIIFLSLFVYILWSTTYPLKGFFSPEIFFKADPLLMIATSIAERVMLAGLLWAAVMILAALVFGRFFCGWICPLGAVIDAGRAFVPRLTPLPGSGGGPRSVKFIFLAGIILAALAGVQLAWLGDPIVVAGRFVSLNLIPGVTAAADWLFSSAIRTFGLYGGVYDLYRDLKMSLLGVKVRFFSHGLPVLAEFFAIVWLARYAPRYWCRYVCPLGAVYAVPAKYSRIERIVQPCSRCMKCKTVCRMGAIRDDLSYDKGECVMCMDCVAVCPQNSTRFGFARGKRSVEDTQGGVTRRQFMCLAAVALGSARTDAPVAVISGKKAKQRVIRPPASLPESEFIDRCVRCGNCMKVCITNGLQPAFLQAGLQGIWTPHLVPEIGYCEYHCTLCGNVCPTGAIGRLTEGQKLRTRLGLARIDRSLCLPWKKKKNCIVCEEHCPVPNKAIQLKEAVVDGQKVLRPYINEHLCIGCGICQTKCPVRPERAIKVYPVKVTHSGK